MTNHILFIGGPGEGAVRSESEGGGKRKKPYHIKPSLPAESYSNGGTAHAGKPGHTGFVQDITPGLGKPPLRFLPWAEIFGYKPAQQNKIRPIAYD